MATLEEIQLKFGHLLQLQMPRQDQSRLYGKLIGYLVDQAVLVTLPGLGEQAVPAAEGDTLVCRGFAGRSAFGFQTRVTKVMQTPFPHLYLAYPKTVESVLVRKSARLATQLDAVLLKSAEQGEVREPATLIDISASGGCATAKADFAAVKDSLTLVLPARAADEPEIRFAVIVRSARVSDPGASQSAPQGAACQYGMEFVDLSAEQKQALEKLLQQQLARTL